MFIKVIAADKGFVFDVGLVSGNSYFRDVIEKYGNAGFAFVAYVADSDNLLFAYQDEKDRITSALQSTNLNPKDADDKIVKEAIKEYSRLQSIDPRMRTKQTFDRTIDKINKYLDSTVIDDKNSTSVRKMLIELTDVFESRERFNKIGDDEKEEVVKTVANRKLSVAEKLAKKK